MSVTVKKKPGETKRDLIARFRKIFLELGIMEKVKEKTAYIKPSRRRYEKRKALEALQRRNRHE